MYVLILDTIKDINCVKKLQGIIHMKYTIIFLFMQIPCIFNILKQ